MQRLEYSCESMNSLVNRQLMLAVYRYRNGPVPFGLAVTFFASLALFWTVCTGAIDYFVLSTAVRHCVAAGFPKAEGRIIESEVDPERLGGGVEKIAIISFRYRVDGKEYETNHFRFDDVWSGRPEETQEVVAAYPVGRTVNVFYDPTNPSRAALTVGLIGADLVSAMAVLPLNLLVLWLWGFIGRMTYRHFVKPPGGGATISSDGYTTHVRLAVLPLSPSPCYTFPESRGSERLVSSLPRDSTPRCRSCTSSGPLSSRRQRWHTPCDG